MQQAADITADDSIDKYYTTLTYDERNSNIIAKKKLHILTKQLRIDDPNDITKRFFETATIIKTHFALFYYLLKHVDVVTTITQYLNGFGRMYALEEEAQQKYLVIALLFTLFDISNNADINLFLLSALVKGSKMGSIIEQYAQTLCVKYTNIEKETYQNHRMIILEDSDLYAVVKHFKRFEHLTRSAVIFVQEVIYSKFNWLMAYYNISPNNILIFRDTKELSKIDDIDNTKKTERITIFSIWSENIIAAKLLAISMTANVVFINTHMNFYGSNLLLCYPKLCIEMFGFSQTRFYLHDNFFVPLNLAQLKKQLVLYNLFYDGKWQKPVRDTYWTDNSKVFANATRSDYHRCFISAKNALKVWGASSYDTKKCFLIQFIHKLQVHGEFQLAERLVHRMKSLKMYVNASVSSQGKEIISIHKSRGVVMLNEGDKALMLERMMMSLMTGNTVIVLATKNVSEIIEWFKIIAECNVPSGIVNLLSSSRPLYNESTFCISYTKSFVHLSDEKIFSSNNTTQIYMSLTMPMYIVLPIF